MNKSKLIFSRRLLAIVISFALVLVSLVGFTLLRSSDVAHADPTDSWTDENNYDTSWYIGHESDTEYTLTTSAPSASRAFVIALHSPEATTSPHPFTSFCVKIKSRST